MTKFGNKYGTTNRTGSSPIKTVGTQSVANHEGAASYARDAKSDLFLLGVMNFVSEDTFYESGQARDARFENLVHQVTREDPNWVERFVPWLRNEANMRSAAVVAAVEYVRAGGPNARKVIDSACARADEPAEVLAYWIGRYGRPVKSSVKRGVNDAVARLWNEYSVAKYDGQSRDFRMGDVVNMTRPKPDGEFKTALYKYVQDTRFGETPNVSGLPMLSLRRAVNSGEVTRDQLLRDPELMKRAGMTWESLSGLGAMDAAAWEAVIPQMGYMALLRNLRNFEQAGISAASVRYVNNFLSDPEKIARSRQLPFRFWSAFKNTSGLKFASAVEAGLEGSLQNLPAFGGKTLVLLDTSASMRGSVGGERSTMTRVEAGAVFAAALALSGENVTLRQFATFVGDIPVQKGGSILRETQNIVSNVGSVGHGTDIAGAMASYDGQDRVVLITDMQTQRAYDRTRAGIPTRVPIFGFNLGGYATTQLGGENEFEFGGLSDQTFKLIPLLERRARGDWPF